MAKTTHGMKGTSEHNAWVDMKQRCFNPNHKRYADYGGRGIKVCDRWKNSFENFFADMRLKPTDKHSIDRINNSNGYCPENCRWSTKKDQQNNQRSNRFITIGCVTLTIAQWTIEMGFSKTVIANRLKYGWSELEAVTIPVGGKLRLITIGSVTLSIAEWTKKMNFGQSVIQSRLNLGWSELDAVMTPIRVKK